MIVSRVLVGSCSVVPKHTYLYANSVYFCREVETKHVNRHPRSVAKSAYSRVNLTGILRLNMFGRNSSLNGNDVNNINQLNVDKMVKRLETHACADCLSARRNIKNYKTVRTSQYHVPDLALFLVHQFDFCRWILLLFPRERLEKQ